MQRSTRAMASALGLTLALTACGEHLSSLPELSGNGSGTSSSATSSSLSDKPLSSIPKLSGELAYNDAGRRAANAPVRVSLTLRYNHQAELDRFVAKRQRARPGSAPAVPDGERI